MKDEFDKCYFCKYHYSYDGCVLEGCDKYESFKPMKEKLIEKAKEKHISVSDVIALINLES